MTSTFDLKRAVLLAAIGEGVLSLMDALMKLMSARYPIFEITFLRFLFGGLVAIGIFVANGPVWPSREAMKFHLLRAVFAVGAATTFFYALSVLPLAEAMALSFVAPIFIALLAVVILKERFDARIGIALAIGLCGMLVIVGGKLCQDNSSADPWPGAIAVLVSAFLYALVMVMLRARANKDPLPTIVLIQNVAPAFLLLIPALLVWQPVSWSDLGVFAVIGVLAASGHMLLANAFMRAEAARLAPIHYLVLVWGTLYGYLIFGDIPGLTTLIGAVLIVFGTLLTRRT